MHGRNTELIVNLSGDIFKFNKLIKKYLEITFEGTEVIITDGPYDSKKDIKLIKKGKERPFIIQTTTTTAQDIEKKFLEDLEEILDIHKSKLENGWKIYYFCSSQLTNQKINKLENLVQSHIEKMDLDIESVGLVDIYEANRLIQRLETDRYQDVLHFLIHDIYRLSKPKKNNLDITEQYFYEYLLFSKESSDFKNALLTAQILNFLYKKEEGLTLDDIDDISKFLEIKSSTLQGKLNNLIKDGKIKKDANSNKYFLTKTEEDKIYATFLKINGYQDTTIELIQEVLKNYYIEDISREILTMFKDAYSESLLDIQLTERDFISPKLSINKNISYVLSEKLRTNSKSNYQHPLDNNTIDDIISKIISIISSNNYLSYVSSAKLSFNLISNYKYNKYTEDKKIFIYLDTPVLIPYLISWRIKDVSLFNDDKSLNNVHKMLDILESVDEKELRISQEHYEETIRLLEQAYRLSLFASEILIKQLGQSKNTFFNIYLRWKQLENNVNKTFPEFLNKLIGFDIDEDINPYNAFRKLSRYSAEILQFKIKIIDSYDADEQWINKIKKSYYQIESNKKRKNSKALDNDLRTLAIITNENLHLNNEGVISIPMLITLDGSQYQLREAVREHKRDAKYYIFTPQRASERLSLLSFKIAPEIIQDGLMAIFYENYFYDEKGRSLLDTIANIINPAEEGTIIDSIVKVYRKLLNENIEQSEIEFERRNFLSDILSYTYENFNFELVKVLFQHDKFKLKLEHILLDIITNNTEFNTSLKERYTELLTKLLDELNNESKASVG